MARNSRISRRSRRKPPIRGIVLHRGDSPGTGDPYVVIATLESLNSKTGNVVTVWIVHDTLRPTKAKRAGQEHATCLDCPLGMHGGCYVQVDHAPTAIWECYKRGGYEEYEPRRHDPMIRGRVVRWGGYGEPVLIPLPIIEAWSLSLADGWTGYTHQWRRREYQGYRAYFMASVHSKAQRDLAWGGGWRTFRDCTSLADEPIDRGEFGCPAAYEQGERMQCIDCRACDGANRPVGLPQRASVVIERHANAVETLRLNKAIRLGIVSFGS